LNIGIYFKEILWNKNKENEINRKNKNYILDRGLNGIYEKNIINFILDIELNESEIIIVNQNENNKKEIKDNANIFIGNKKINMIIEENKWIIDYKFEKEGKYNLKIIFNNNINDMNSIFENCSNIYSIDLSNFNISSTINMEGMLNNYHKLKEIKGINNFNTNQVKNMRIMFQKCYELEYLDLSNFNTSKVNDMEGMFNNCHKLRVIKGINKFNTNQVTNMKAMFQAYFELEYLDLSNFNTSKVNNMELCFLIVIN